MAGATIQVTGLVQGVGFRPYIYGLATRLALRGWVRNTSAGVDIEVDGAPAALAELVRVLPLEAPPLARVEAVRVAPRPANGFETFTIGPSAVAAAGYQPVPPDTAVCADCLRELFDPADRRYRYPFINCTHCGPRFTLIRGLPYDRPLTTMAAFGLCADCAREYQDPADRRFHAQPVACPACGPHLWLEYPGRPPPAGPPATEDAIQAARELLAAGAIVAIKGLGGFHLACDAANAAAVAELRRRKHRAAKPLALMMSSLEAVAAHCLVSPAERALLEAPSRPIVLLQRRPGSSIALGIAPGVNTLGVMLPYTPLHYLLTAEVVPPLVMTSGNVSDEPMVTTNDAARERLAGLADAVMMHDRDIYVRCDDSVIRAGPAVAPASSETRAPVYPLRRARGLAPAPIRLPVAGPPTLAAGGDLKSAFCLTRGEDAFLSHYIGDLESYATLQAYASALALFEDLFHIRPEVIAHDLHPDYVSTRQALERAKAHGIQAIAVQHHHAHIAACMADNGLSREQRVIGVALDGTGYGPDRAIWGGEFLVAGYAGYERPLHLAYIPLPGGGLAVREPWRMALAWLAHSGLDWSEDLPPMQHALNLPLPSGVAVEAVRRQINSGLNAPPTSSMGRLFDAAAALLGIRQTVTYEGQAAIELEALADPHETGAYEFDLTPDLIDPAPMFRAIVRDRRAGVAPGRIAARFHNTLVNVVAAACQSLRGRFGLRDVALSGGVWQNMTLLARTLARLAAEGFTVIVPRQVPPNDGGLALGQAAVVLARLAGDGRPHVPGRAR